jgi:8-oxo-dGTP pyrophosphatase MutT (NUDIX family)
MMAASSGYGAGVANTWLSTEEWFASLPTAYLSAGLILTDRAGRLLVVKPNYRDDGWSIPGGIVEHGEPPHVAASREVAEELGLHIPAGDLLVADWVAPAGERPRAITTYLFDGGTVEDPGAIRLQEEELDAAEFVSWAEAEARMPAHTAARVPAARQARDTGRTVYLPAWPGR